MNIIPPHKTESRSCFDTDVERIQKDAKEMIKICQVAVGQYNGAHALSHAQVTDEEPLRFFVTFSGQIVVNPSILKQTKHKKPVKEACITFYKHDPVYVDRPYKITAQLQHIKNGKLTSPETVEIKGIHAQIFLHQTDIMNTNYIYDTTDYKKQYPSYKRPISNKNKNKEGVHSEKSELREASEASGRK